MATYWIARANVNKVPLHKEFVTCKVWFTNAPRCLRSAGTISCGDKIALVADKIVFARGVVVSEKAASLKEKTATPFNPSFKAVIVEWIPCDAKKMKAPSTRDCPHYQRALSKCREKERKAIWGDEA